jgi:TolB-like protein/cytochrome c-type biogenesis protein CcmH/NrfG
LSFFNELKRRNVFKVGIAYVVVAWLVAQVLQLVFESFGTPEWVMKTVLVLLATGLPFALFFAWAFEMTPEGLKRESEVDRSQSITPQTGQKLNVTIFVVMALALGYFAVDKFYISAEREAALVESVAQAKTAQPPVQSPQDIDRSIAVLPFADMSPDKDQEYFTDGLSEELLNLLAKIPELKVASRSSAFQFKDKGVDILEVGKQLKVAHVLEGSVRKDGNQLRITAQLIKAADGYHLWSETYDRELKGVFAIQDEIATAVVAALKLTLLGESLKVRHTNPETYAQYLQGRYFYNLSGEENYRKAATAYQTVLAVDPEYVPALAGLSRVYLEQANVGFINAIEGMVLARSMAERAVSLDPNSAEAWASLGRIRWSYDWNWEGAEDADRKALALEPGNVDVITQSARVSSTYGRFDKTIELNREAISLDPLSLRPLFNLGLSYLDAGRFADAEAMFRKVLELNPQYTAAQLNLGTALLLKGELESALREIEQESTAVWKGFGMALVYVALARKDEAREALDTFVRDYGAVGAYQVAEVYAFAGDVDQSFEWLERAYSQRDGGLTALLGDQLLKSLHTDPRWEPLLDKMGLLPYWYEMKGNRS